MKKTGLLHADLSRLIATLGHGDMLVIGDAGLPIPNGPLRIDLALVPGVPSVAQVLRAVLLEMQVERTMIARESVERAAPAALPTWYSEQLTLAPEQISHDDLKQLSVAARAVVRTGECTPYANVVLVAGVTF
ncbi:MAG: D-ribose pyranase [Burkholderiales bacterium]